MELFCLWYTVLNFFCKMHCMQDPMDGHSPLNPVAKHAVMSSLLQMSNAAAVFSPNGNIDAMIF